MSPLSPVSEVLISPKLKGTCGSDSTSVHKLGHPELLAQDHTQMVLEYFQGWRLHNLSGECVPVLSRPHSRKVFPDVPREPLPIVLSLGTTEMRLASFPQH